MEDNDFRDCQNNNEALFKWRYFLMRLPLYATMWILVYVLLWFLVSISGNFHTEVQPGMERSLAGVFFVIAVYFISVAMGINRLDGHQKLHFYLGEWMLSAVVLFGLLVVSLSFLILMHDISTFYNDAGITGIVIAVIVTACIDIIVIGLAAAWFNDSYAHLFYEEPEEWMIATEAMIRAMAYAKSSS